MSYFRFCPLANSLVAQGGRGLLCAVLALFALTAVVGPAQAAIIPIAPPPSTLPGALESNANIYLFLEKEIVLASDLPVDISAPGFYNIGNPAAAGVIKAGTKIRSYMLHHETVDNSFASASGIVVSPQKIIGIIYSDTLLSVTDPLLGAPSTLYPTNLAYRGMELTFPVTPDSLLWAGNQVTLAVVSNAALVVDQMRVITVVPEPGMFTLAALGGGALAIVARLRKRKQA